MKILACNATVAEFSAANEPALMVSQGEVFAVQTNDRFAAALHGQVPSPASVGALVGPVHVSGVMPGDVLAIRIVDIQARTPHGYVLTSPGYGILGDQIERRVSRVQLTDGGVVFESGIALAAKPMIGKLGLAPAGPAVAGTACGAHGGALSNTHLGPGATLLLIAGAEGAGLCLEDVHARMGDGEVTASAVEMAALVTLECSIYRDMAIQEPLLLTQSEVITFGHGDSLDEAVHGATTAMLRLIMARTGMDLTAAAALVGAAVDLRIAFAGALPKKAFAAVARDILGF